MVPWVSLAHVLGDAAEVPPAASSLPRRFVSDYAFAGYKPVCQRKLMHAMARSQLGAAAARTFPPSLLEWTANRQQASMALDLHCFNGARRRGAGGMVVGRVGPGLTTLLPSWAGGDRQDPLTAHPSPGDQFSCPIHSWSTGEDLAGDVLKHRYPPAWQPCTQQGEDRAQHHPGAILGDSRTWEPGCPDHGQGVPMELGHRWQPVPVPSILLSAGAWWRAGVAGPWP